MKTRHNLKYKSAIEMRLDSMMEKYKRQLDTVYMLKLYKHLLGCDYLNEDGVHHVNMVLENLEK